MDETYLFSYPNTNQAQPYLASEIRQDWEHSGWYGIDETYLKIQSLFVFQIYKTKS